MAQKHPIHPILEEIEAYCAARGIGQSVFGDKAINDPRLVATIKSGRDVGHRLACEIREFMRTGVSSRAPRAKQKRGRKAASP